MKKVVKNKLAMYGIVRQVITDFGTSWNTIPAFVSAVEKLQSKYSVLVEIGEKQTKILKGVWSAKEKKKMVLIDEATKLSNALFAYAGVVDNTILKEQMRLSKSELKYSNRVSLLTNLSLIATRSAEFASELEDYGVQAETIEAYSEMVEEYNEIVHSTRKAVISRKQLTHQIDVLVSEIDDVLSNQIDKLVEVIRTDDSLFFEKYQHARSIVDYPSGHKSKKTPDDENPSSSIQMDL